MPREDHITLVRRFYSARGDMAEISAVMDANATWDISPGFPGGGVYQGLTAITSEFLAPLARGFASLSAHPEHMHTDGDRVFVSGRYAGVSKTGAPFAARFVHIWTITNNLIVHNYQVADSAVVASHFSN